MPGNPVRRKPEKDLSDIPGTLSPEQNRQRIKSEDEAMKAFIASLPEGDALDYLRAPFNLFSNSMAGLGAEMLGKGKQFEAKYGWTPKNQAEMSAVNSLLKVMDPAIEVMDYLKIPPVVGPNVPTIAAAMRGVDRAAVNLTGQQAAEAARKGATAAKNAVRDVATSDAAYDIMNRLADAAGVRKQIMMGKKSRTWNPNTEREATIREMQRQSTGDIWRETGNYRGAKQGDWRQEIADYPMAYTPNNARQALQRRIKQAEARTAPEDMADFEEWRNQALEDAKSNVIGTVGDFIDHPELKAAYPELFSMAFKQLSPDHPQWTAARSSWGFFDPRKKTIAINSNIPDEVKRATALHELQHAVQDIEGWQGGSNPALMSLKMYQREQAKEDLYRLERSLEGMRNSDPNKYASQIQLEEQELKKVQDQLNKTSGLEGVTDPFKAYEKTAGEEEARMVERRSKYPEADLKFYSPHSDFDTDLRKQITDFAAGGAVMMAKGGILGAIAKTAEAGVERAAKTAKAMQQVLPVIERDANLAKFLEPSAVQMRLYHGTPATEGGKGKEAIRRIKPSKEGALGSGAYLTPDPRYASGYANEGDANVLPVYAQIKNPLKIEGTHGDPMIEALIKLGMDEDQAARMVEKAYEDRGYIGKQVQNRAQSAGYDGLVQYRDGSPSEVVVYNPNAIKSAIGNQGTYDVSHPDLSKAEGGDVTIEEFLKRMKAK